MLNLPFQGRLLPLKPKYAVPLAALTALGTTAGVGIFVPVPGL